MWTATKKSSGVLLSYTDNEGCYDFSFASRPNTEKVTLTLPNRFFDHLDVVISEPAWLEHVEYSHLFCLYDTRFLTHVGMYTAGSTLIITLSEDITVSEGPPWKWAFFLPMSSASIRSTISRDVLNFLRPEHDSGRKMTCLHIGDIPLRSAIEAFQVHLDKVAEVGGQFEGFDNNKMQFSLAFR